MNLVESSSSLSYKSLPHGRQPTVLLLVVSGNVNASNGLQFLAVFESVAIKPEYFAESVGIASVGFRFGLRIGLHHDDLLAAWFVLQDLDKPIFKSAGFQQHDEIVSFEFIEELPDFVRPSTDLSSADDVTAFLSNADGKLLAMEVDTDV
jgi:hypothetical protein